MQLEANYKQQHVHLMPGPGCSKRSSASLCLGSLILFSAGVSFLLKNQHIKHWNTFHMHENYIRHDAVVEAFEIIMWQMITPRDATTPHYGSESFL